MAEKAGLVKDGPVMQRVCPQRHAGKTADTHGRRHSQASRPLGSLHASHGVGRGLGKLVNGDNADVDFVRCVEAGKAETHGTRALRAKSFVHERGAVGAWASADTAALGETSKGFMPAILNTTMPVRATPAWQPHAVTPSQAHKPSSKRLVKAST